ncbi:MAG TPA: RDD family protein [Solirubrobacteraceae bacterium]|nr:RDD family protein [Solirubrobacteraceae bacterium]
MSDGKTPNRRSRAARPLSAMGSLAAASLKPLREGATEVVLDSQFFQSLLADALDSEQVQTALTRALETEGAEHVVDTLFESGLVDEFVDGLVENGTVWMLINAMLVSDGAEQLAGSDALWGLIDKALESENADRLVAKLLDSGLADGFVDRLLTSKALWRLVDEIAASPAVTAAVTQQSLGFADQVGGELRARARRADDWILQKARGDGNGHRPSAPATTSAPPGEAEVQAASRSALHPVGPAATAVVAGTTPGADTGETERRYTGIVARTLAFTLDAVLIVIPAFIVEIGGSLIVTVAHLPSNWKSTMVAVGALAFVLWAMLYFVVFWWTTGQTPGARIMEFRVLPDEGDKLTPWRAVVRAVGLVLAAIPLFAGYLPVAFGRKRRGLQDYLARTHVIDAPQLSVAETRLVAANAAQAKARLVVGSPRSRDATSPEDAQPPGEPDQGAPSAHQNADPSGPHHHR